MLNHPRELILVSHRLPVEVQQDENGFQVRPSPGGLARALNDLLRRHKGSWIGHPGIEDVDVDQQLQSVSPYNLVPVTLSRREKELYYLGFSNQILWPLFHDLHPYCDFEPTFWDTYQEIDERFARTVAATGDEDQIVWVHDYHLMLVPRMLREAGDTRRLGFFLHIPFPPAETLQRLPWHRELLSALIYSDLIGFQTRRDLRNFSVAVRTLLDDVQVSARGNEVFIETPRQRTRAGVFPISMDTDAIQRESTSAEVGRRCAIARESIGRGQTTMVGVERLDYTKGIPERLRAYHLALERYPEMQGRVTYLQHINPSREELPLYQELKDEVDRLVGHINGAFGTIDWVPVRYSYGNLDFHDVLALYRLADVALVTPLRDGMNLVCKEYCIAKDEDEEGVLILSRFAGAAEQLDDALLVNPHDIEELARAIQTACTMDAADKRTRMQALQRRIRQHDVHAWAQGFLDGIAQDAIDRTVESAA